MKFVIKTQLFLKIVHTFLDIIFPPTKTWIEIRNWKKDDLIHNCEKTEYSKSIFKYSDPHIQEIIYSIKFRNNRYFTNILGEIMWEKIRNKKGILIPIPIHKIRKRERGYNQCEWLCEEIKKHDNDNNLEYNPNVLERIKYTPKQSKSSFENRKNNMNGVFQINGDIKGKNIILIDDVITTGNTIKEAQKVLLRAGAKYIHVLTIAH